MLTRRDMLNLHRLLVVALVATGESTVVGGGGEFDWAPDGSYLVLGITGQGGAVGDVVVVEPDGSNPVVVAQGSHPLWQPLIGPRQ